MAIIFQPKLLSTGNSASGCDY